MVTSEQLKIGMKVKRNTRTWVDAKRLSIEEGMIGEVLPNPEQIGVRALFENGVDIYCWGDDLDAVPPNVPDQPSRTQDV
jgi:hypothetical protein